MGARARLSRTSRPTPTTTSTPRRPAPSSGHRRSAGPPPTPTQQPRPAPAQQQQRPQPARRRALPPRLRGAGGPRLTRAARCLPATTSGARRAGPGGLRSRPASCSEEAATATATAAPCPIPAACPRHHHRCVVVVVELRLRRTPRPALLPVADLAPTAALLAPLAELPAAGPVPRPSLPAVLPSPCDIRCRWSAPATRSPVGLHRWWCVCPVGT